MDFLDPAKQRAHQIRLMVGYVLLAIAVVLAATVLLYQAHGFGVKAGKVIQNGLVFVQSMPGSADIYLNGNRTGTTSARLTLEAGTYTMRLTRPGYRDWQRTLTVEGGSVEHFAYPFLIPSKLTAKPLAAYDAEPGIFTQTPDRRWLLVEQPGQLGSFDIYDAKDPKKTPQLKQTETIPPALFSLPAAELRGLNVVDWSNDNDHVLLQYTSGGQSEYLLFSRKAPDSSVNLTQKLGLAPGVAVSLQDKKYDHYFLHDPAAKTLSTASLSDPQPVPLLDQVLAYKTYGSGTVLYASPVSNQPDKVQVKMYLDNKQYVLRTLPASPTYLMDLTRYNNAWIVMAGVPSENRVYIYKDPVAALQQDPAHVAVPVSVLKLANPSNAAISANSQLMMAENGSDFSVYDVEYDRTLTYRMDQPLDQPQTKAIWLDDHHLGYTSGGKTIFFDYDGTNAQTLAAQDPALPALYDTGYATVYTVAKAPADSANPAGYVLSATPLRTPADQ